MIAIREFAVIKDNKLIIDLPNDFNYEKVEVIILPLDEKKYDFWNEKDLEEIEKIGLISSSFEEDNEDYSTW